MNKVIKGISKVRVVEIIHTYWVWSNPSYNCGRTISNVRYKVVLLPRRITNYFIMDLYHNDPIESDGVIIAPVNGKYKFNYYNDSYSMTIIQ